MSWNKYLGVVASGALVGVVALANGCSSSSSKAGAGDGGNDSGTIHHPDTGTSSGAGDDSGGDDSGGTVTDGTTGKQCTTDADCSTGPGVDKCSNTNGGMGFFTVGQLFSTPVCLIPPSMAGNCDPGSDGNLHFCDGPDDPSSPGVCLEDGSATVGICLPQCAFAQDGSAATGCVGTDVCNVAGFASASADGGNAAVGIGYCFGGCITDADCQAGQKCQTDEGICVAAPTAFAAQGTGCKASSTGASTPACNCIANTSTNEGYCGQFCKTGGTACPTGSICDAQLPLTLVNSDDAAIPGWTTANPGLAGFCTPSCVIDGGASDEAGTCYANTTCQSGTVGGPNCLP